MGEVETLTGGCLSVIISLCYCYLISSKIPKGKYRFISILPIFYLFTIFPLYISSTTFFTCAASLLITSAANSKLLLYAFDQGPLSYGPPRKSLLLFITIASLPIKTKDHNYTDPKSTSISRRPKKIPLNFTVKTLLVTMFISLMDADRKHKFMHQNAVFVLYNVLLYLMLDLEVASATATVGAMVGLEFEAPSDEPYLSTSLQDFWGKMWNLIATNILQNTVYLPVKSASTGLLGKNAASLVAVASFFVSGLMHEVMLYHMSREIPTWECGSFFVLHGICVIVEMVLKRTVGRRLRLPPYFGPQTVKFVVLTGIWLFFRPMINHGIDKKMIGEFIFVLESMKGKMQMIYPLAIQQK